MSNKSSDTSNPFNTPITSPMSNPSSIFPMQNPITSPMSGGSQQVPMAGTLSPYAQFKQRGGSFGGGFAGTGNMRGGFMGGSGGIRSPFGDNGPDWGMPDFTPQQPIPMPMQNSGPMASDFRSVFSAQPTISNPLNFI